MNEHNSQRALPFDLPGDFLRFEADALFALVTTTVFVTLVTTISFPYINEARAAASRAIGTRNGEQLT